MGGGLSGLTAAYRIQTDLPNVKVTVLEANSYPGGRMLTTDFGAEAGGESIGFYYGALHNLANEIGVPIDSTSMTILNQAFNIAYYWKSTKEWVQQKDWARWEGNPLPPELRDIPPIMILRHYADKIPRPQWDKLLDSPQMEKLASTSLLDFLKQQHAPDSVIPFVESNFEVNDDLSHLSAFSSLLKTWLTELMAESRYYYVRGGNQNLPKKLAQKLHVIYNQKVTDVEEVKSRYKITTQDGKTYEADYVIFTVPANPMKEINISPPLEGIQKEAFEKIQYTPSIKVFFKAKEPFWEKDNLPLFMWTDTEVNMVIPVYDKETRESPISGPKIWGFYTISNGMKASRLYENAKQGVPIHEQCQKILEEIRPSMKGCIEYVEMMDWGHQPNAQGAFHYYTPDPKILDYYRNISKPSKGLFFAGEHTEHLHKGFDAAVFSGLRAAREVCENIVNRKILILGTGNLGLALAKKCRDKFYSLRLTTTTESKKSDLKALTDDVHLLKLEDTEESLKQLENAIKDCDVVVCLIGPSPAKIKSPFEMKAHYTQSLITPAKLLEKALSKHPKKPHLIFTSALNVYGTGEQEEGEFVTEETPVSPTNLSASTYSEAEKIYLSIGDHTTILRLGALYDFDKLAFSHQAKMAVKRMGGVSPFDPDGFFLKLHLDDAAKALEFIIENKRFGIFNVCEDKQTLIKEYFAQLCERQSLPQIKHMGFIKSPHKKVSCKKIKDLGYSLSYPRLLFIGSGELVIQALPVFEKENYFLYATTTSEDKAANLSMQYPYLHMSILEGSDEEAVKKIISDKEVVIIAVAPIKKRIKSFTDKEALHKVVIDTYLTTNQNLVKAWNESVEKPQVIYISAHAVYPNNEGDWVDENTFTIPRHAIASILLDAEKMIRDWIKHAVILRLGWMINPRRNWKQTLEAWKRALPNYEISGDGKMRANFVNIHDAARSILFSLNQNLSGIYNVCNDAHPYWGDLFEIVAEQAGIEPPNWNPDLEDSWFEGDHRVSSQKIKDAGFTFLYPRDMGLSFLFHDPEKEMREHLQSALMTAWIRAIEKEKKYPLFEDPFAAVMTNAPALDFLCTRTAMYDESLKTQLAKKEGNLQFVNLGAGMDMRPFRLKELENVICYENDLPMVMKFKQQLLQKNQIHRENYILLGDDLSKPEWVKHLIEAGFRQDIPTIWLLEGLVTYFEPKQALDLLQQVARLSAEGSILLVDLPKQRGAEEKSRIKFFTDKPQEWLEKAGWSSIEEITPQTENIRERFEKTDKNIRLFSAVKKENILILGCGYTGTKLLEQLKNQETYRIETSTTTTNRIEELKSKGAKEVLLWKGKEEGALFEFMGRSDVIIASLRSPLHKNEEILESLKIVAKGLKPHQYLILLSSIEVYPPGIQNAKEEEVDLNKIQTQMEKIFESHSNKCILRIGHLFGKGTDQYGKRRNMLGHIEKVFTFTKGVLPDVQHQSVYLTHVNDLLNFLKKAIHDKVQGIFNFCYTYEEPNYRFFEKLTKHYGYPNIQWNKDIPLFPHMQLPQKIDTEKLSQVYSLEKKNYEDAALLDG